MTTLVSRAKGGSCIHCCEDCDEIHKECGCGGCIPERLCVVVELSGPPDPDIGCCQYLWGEMYHECGKDTYKVAVLDCDPLILYVSTIIVGNGDNCCVKTTLSTEMDSVTYVSCKLPGDKKLNFDVLESFSLLYDDSSYPATYVTGDINVFASRGISNPGQFGNIEEGSCPKCRYLRLNPRKEPIPDLPVEGAECERRNNWQNSPKVADRVLDLTDLELFSDEFCWFLPPCKCIPEKVCLKYWYEKECEESSPKRYQLELINCTYGPVTIDTPSGQVTIRGTIFEENICQIVWTVDHYKGQEKIKKGLTRVAINDEKPEEFSKRCEVTVSPAVEIPDTAEFEGGANHTFEVTEECLCLNGSDTSCGLGCYDARMPPVANPDCFLTTLTGEILGCDFGGYSMEFHARPYEAPAASLQNQFYGEKNNFDFPDFPQDPNDWSPCQLYDAYNPELLSFGIQGEGLDCNTPGSYGPPHFGDVNTSAFRFSLGYPTLCDVEPTAPPVPNQYILFYEIFQVCGLPTSYEIGAIHPSSSSCDPFELLFDVPFTSICDCSCTSFKLKITL